MITVRTEDNLMVYKFTGLKEQALRECIAVGAIPAQSVTLKPDSDYSKGFVVTEDWKWDLPEMQLFLWKGTRF
jgi:hypothetical protein